MDIIFNCSNCEQELAVDASASGSEIQCPTCQSMVAVPEPTDENTQTTASAVPEPSEAPAEGTAGEAPKVEKHFVVPQRATPGEALIKKPKPTLEVAATEADKLIRVKTIRHGDCVEVGKDRFDEFVTDFLQKIGEKHIISITPVTYTHMDAAGREMTTDYAVLIVFKG